ncbi:hypothetical protein [Haloferula sp. BvORR071]|uniref:hypothetical protein n=1 Tax=Haloferula sp. BvORR071 TaxID=1396141 RepID=UPI0005520264|nr:hypothetical protein [Haloferula sp. BvORR071]
MKEFADIIVIILQTLVMVSITWDMHKLEIEVEKLKIGDDTVSIVEEEIASAGISIMKENLHLFKGAPRGPVSVSFQLAERDLSEPSRLPPLIKYNMERVAKLFGSEPQRGIGEPRCYRETFDAPGVGTIKFDVWTNGRIAWVLIEVAPEG